MAVISAVSLLVKGVAEAVEHYRTYTGDVPRSFAVEVRPSEAYDGEERAPLVRITEIRMATSDWLDLGGEA